MILNPEKKISLVRLITQHVYFWWVLLFFGLNLYNRQLLLPVLAGLGFAGLLFLAWRYGLPSGYRQTWTMQKLLSSLRLKDQYRLNPLQAGAIFLVLCFVLSNFFLLSALLAGSFTLGSILKAELFIAYYLVSSFAFVALIFAFSLTLGQTLLKLIKLDGLTAIDDLVKSGLGFFALSMLGLFLAFTGLLYQPILILATIILGAVYFKKIIKLAVKPAINLRLAGQQSLAVFLYLLLALGLAISFNNAIFPSPIDIDSLHSYFNSPRLYAQNHGYELIPNFNNASMGQNIEMLYTAAISLLGSRFVMHFSWLFLVLSLITAYRLAREYLSSGAWLFPVMLFFVPWNFYFIYTAKTELALNFFSFLVLGIFLSWLNKPHSKKLYLLGIFSGIIVGVKYNSLLLLAPIYLFIFVSFLRRRTGQQFYPIILSGLLALLLFLPWGLKNAIYFQNPLHPYKLDARYGLVAENKNVFDQIDNQYKKDRMAEVNNIKFAYDHQSPAGVLKTILRQASAYNISPNLFFNYGFLPLISLPFLFFLKNKRAKSLLVLVFLYLVLYSLTGTGARSWYAFTGISLIYFVLPLLFLERKKLLSLYAVIAATIFLTNFLYQPQNLRFITGQENGYGFLYSHEPSFETAQFLNSAAARDGNMIILGDFRVAYIDNNHNRAFIDPYLIRSGYYLRQNMLNDFVAQNRIKYLVYANHRLDGLFSGYLDHTNTEKKDYLNAYRQRYDGPSIYEDMELIQNYLAQYRLAYSNKNYKIYQIHE